MFVNSRMGICILGVAFHDETRVFIKYYVFNLQVWRSENRNYFSSLICEACFGFFIYILICSLMSFILFIRRHWGSSSRDHEAMSRFYDEWHQFPCIT